MKPPCVLIFAGSDPSGGAGVQADIQAVAALGAHPLSVITALTVQDNDRVFSVHPAPAALVEQQARALLDKIDIGAVKVGIAGNRANAEAIANIVRQLKDMHPGLPVVVDTVLASGHGDALSSEHPLRTIEPLLAVATLITPNLPEAAALCGGDVNPVSQAQALLGRCPNVLIKGGHGAGAEVENRWFAEGISRTWRWPRLAGGFHGTGCMLASAIAALLASGASMEAALEAAQAYCHQALLSSYAIADGQRIPGRWAASIKENT